MTTYQAKKSCVAKESPSTEGKSRGRLILRHFIKIFARSVCTVALSLMTLTAYGAVGTTQSADERAWMLQLGYFSNLQNALDLKEQLTDAGFETETIATGDAGEQIYRVIAGWADDPENFDSLRNRIQDAIGERGYVLENPYLVQAAQLSEEPTEELFDQPHTRYLLAQAGNARPMGGESAGSAAGTGYNTDMFRTPQQEMASIPGFTGAGMQIIPTLGLSIGYDDNITRSSIYEQSSWFYIISPAIRVEIPSDHSVLAFTGAVDIYRYIDSETDNREPWFLRADWVWDISTRQDLNLFAQYGEGADQRGTGRRQGDIGLIPLPLDEWERIDYGGTWRYGAIGARGKLDLDAGGSKLTYTNYRNLPGDRPGTTKLDRDWWYTGATFYWRVAPKTSVLANVHYTDIDYKVADNDSTETAWMLGVTWEASARTSGRISYGDQKKKFDNPEYGDYSGPTWLASIDWRPRTYSVFTLTTTRNTQEPDGNAQYVVRQDISLAWVHNWATRFGTMVDVGYGEDDYRPNVRTDNLFYWSVGAHYSFNQHFRLGASIQGYDRSSDEREFDYTRNLYLLTLEASL